MEYKIVFAGAGGTGGNVVTNFCRMIEFQKNIETKMIVADGDLIEKKNKERQPYSYNEEGLNKAEVLAYKCSQVFDVNISAYPYFIEDIDILDKLFDIKPYQKTVPILVGCVDNNRARVLFNEYFNKVENLFYIDSGNEVWDGQVVCGVRAKGKTIAPPVVELYPDILNTQEIFKSEMSCTELMLEKPQQFITNLQAAVITLSYLLDIITGDLKRNQSTFNIKTKGMRSTNAPWAENLDKIRQRKIIL